MCADDVACTGAEPLAFLDYIAVGRLDPEQVAALVAGHRGRAAARPARRSSAARPPSTRASWSPTSSTSPGSASGSGSGAGCSTGRRRAPGDAIVGLASSGLHANGYSLVRALVADHHLALDVPYGGVACRALGCSLSGFELIAEPGLIDATLGEVLLTPTRIYARDLLATPRRARGRGPRGPRHGPHHRRRAPGQRAAGAAGGPRGAPGPVALAAAVGHARARRAGRHRRAGAAGDVQRRARDGRGRAARGGGTRRWSWRRRAVCRRGSSARSWTAAAIGGTVRGGGAGPGERTDRGRGLGDRVEPAGAGRRRGARRAGRRGRAGVRGPRLPGARLGGGAGDRHDPRPGRRRRGARGDAGGRRAGRRRAGRLPAPRRAGGARRVRRADPQRAPVAAARVPGPARGPRRARRGRRGDRRDRPPRRRDARRRPDRRPGGGPGPARRQRGDAAGADPPGRAPAAAGGRGGTAGRAR